jgi:hypothetical protein
MRILSRYGLLIFSIFLTLVAYNNCSKVKFVPTSTSSPSFMSSAADPTLTDPTNQVVCDPFGGSSSKGANLGLLASGVTYVDQSRLAVGVSAGDFMSDLGNSVESLLQHRGASPVGYSPVNLFISAINFPAMYFSQGFLDSSTGVAVKDAGGNMLTEYFGFRLQGQFVTADWPAGDYQIASLTDDGSILTMSRAKGDGSDFVINNDGMHSMKLGCSNSVVHVTAQSKFAFAMDYMQGPRVTIGLMLLYRPVSLSGDAQEPLCGLHTEDDTYFRDHDDNKNPIVAEPQSAYLQLTGAFDKSTGSGGWTVIESDHYNLPENASNPCAKIQ